MNKLALIVVFILVFGLCLFSVEGAVRGAARVAGYHSVLYANSVQTADDAVNYFSVLPQSLYVGWGVPGRYLSIVGMLVVILFLVLWVVVLFLLLIMLLLLGLLLVLVWFYCTVSASGYYTCLVIS
jgi:hypothetical protein